MFGRCGMHSQTETQDPEQPCLGCMQAVLLAQVEAHDCLRGRVTVVPFAKPLGLRQVLHGDHTERFDRYDGRNFNRDYPDLSDDPDRNIALIRDGLHQHHG